MVSSGLLQTQLSFCVFVGAQLSGNFLKIAFLKQKGATLFFSDFLRCKFNLCFFFLCLLKHYKNRGRQQIFVFCC